MVLDFVSVLNCELLANVSCNSFAKALMKAHYDGTIIIVNNATIADYNNIVSIIEFKFSKTVMCIGYPVMYDKDKDIYVIDLDNLVVANIEYDISNTVANYDYVCKTNNITAANVDWLYSVVNTTLASKVVREV